MLTKRILIIDDEADILEVLRLRIEHCGYQVLTALSGEEGVALYKKERADVVVCDLLLPGMDGLQVLSHLLGIDPNATVIMLTAHGSLESAIEAVRLGAFHHLQKPVDSTELVANIEKAIEKSSLEKELIGLPKGGWGGISYEDFVAATDNLAELSPFIEKVALSHAATVLLEGESGSGKNLVAALIHFKSRRARRPFVEINCASIPETLIESELFGHERGAFTDARELKRGLFEVVNGGTLFLDEISEMSPSLQAKILLTIETRHFRRVGGVKDHLADVRIIAATNVDLRKSVTEGRFREDLYYRLQLVPIRIPPLRERRDQLSALIYYFINKFNQHHQNHIKGITSKAEALLEDYQWPGNVRELKNVIERIAILDKDVTIDVSHLPPEIRRRAAPESVHYQIPKTGINLEEVERELIQDALNKADRNQSRAAALLGLTRHTLRYRMKKFELV